MKPNEYEEGIFFHTECDNGLKMVKEELRRVTFSLNFPQLFFSSQADADDRVGSALTREISDGRHREPSREAARPV